MVEEINKGLEPYIRENSLVPDAYFSVTKIKWLLDKVPGAREEAREASSCLNSDTWLIWNLTKGRTYVTIIRMHPEQCYLI